MTQIMDTKAFVFNTDGLDPTSKHLVERTTGAAGACPNLTQGGRVQWTVIGLP